MYADDNDNFKIYTFQKAKTFLRRFAHLDYKNNHLISLKCRLSW